MTKAKPTPVTDGGQAILDRLAMRMKGRTLYELFSIDPKLQSLPDYVFLSKKELLVLKAHPETCAVKFWRIDGDGTRVTNLLGTPAGVDAVLSKLSA